MHFNSSNQLRSHSCEPNIIDETVETDRGGLLPTSGDEDRDESKGDSSFNQMNAGFNLDLANEAQKKQMIQTGHDSNNQEAEN